MTAREPGEGHTHDMDHTVVLSDIHLCELERTDGLWMRYRQAPFCPDQELVAMLGELKRQVHGDRLTLVLNGDIFDLDAPRVIDGESVFHDLPRDAEHTLPMLGAILDDHPLVVRALGELLADGHRVVFLSGNHDIQLTLPEARALLTERMVAAARDVGGGAGVAERVVFRSWFHRTDDGIVIEHGHQYDGYCSFRYPMAPFGRDGVAIQPTVGSLTSRLLTARMGFFNPHVDGSYMLTTLGYLGHWVRRYMLSKHSLVVSWMVGAVQTMVKLLSVREPHDARRSEADIVAAARETGVSPDVLREHAKLFVTPAEDNPARVLRELWLDRLALGALVALGVGWALLLPGSFTGAALGGALFVGYELTVPKPTLDDTWQSVQGMARRVASIHGASAVVFGHTHQSDGRWENGVFLGNSGSWSAAYRDLACTQPLESSRPVIWLRSEGGELRGGMARWVAGAFKMDEGWRASS